MKRDWALLVQAAVVVPFVALLLRMAGLRRTKQFLGLDDASRSQGAVPDSVRRRADAVAAVVRHSPVPVTCLPRSLALAYLARRNGHHVDIVIGVGQVQESGLAAHAWVEYGGLPVNDTPDVRERYNVLTTARSI